MPASQATPVVVITGTSGAGKGTLERPLMERLPVLELAVSATTRPQRPGEKHGVHYWFVDEPEFDRLVEEGAFLEYVVHPWGQRVGTLWSEIDRIRAAGRIPLLDLETKGAKAVEDRLPEAVTIFVKAPSFEELERRLRARATESAGEIEERLRIAREQLEQEGDFDYVIVNDERDRAVAELVAVVREELAAAGTISRP
jgi:guanylate kinase